MGLVGISTQEELDKKLAMPIPELRLKDTLKLKIANRLEERRIFTVEDVLGLTRDELLEIDSFGEKMADDLYRALQIEGFYRDGEEPEQVVRQFVISDHTLSS